VPDVHVPHLGDDEHQPAERLPDAREALAGPAPTSRRWKSLVKVGSEVLLIATGVFLGLLGEQWRERNQHRELAERSLHRFRTEIVANRKAVAAVKDYHVATKQAIDAYFAADATGGRSREVSIKGLQPALFEHTAWDLALVTQALTYTQPELALALSRIYNVQDEYAALSRGILQAMYLRTPSENLDGFLGAVAIYYGDVVGIEPKLLDMYDAIVPQIDRALGASLPDR
jgi:hypothetical protein